MLSALWLLIITKIKT